MGETARQSTSWKNASILVAAGVAGAGVAAYCYRCWTQYSRRTDSGVAALSRRLTYYLPRSPSAAKRGRQRPAVRPGPAGAGAILSEGHEADVARQPASGQGFLTNAGAGPLTAVTPDAGDNAKHNIPVQHVARPPQRQSTQQAEPRRPQRSPFQAAAEQHSRRSADEYRSSRSQDKVTRWAAAASVQHQQQALSEICRSNVHYAAQSQASSTAHAPQVPTSGRGICPASAGLSRGDRSASARPIVSPFAACQDRLSQSPEWARVTLDIRTAGSSPGALNAIPLPSLIRASGSLAHSSSDQQLILRDCKTEALSTPDESSHVMLSAQLHSQSGDALSGSPPQAHSSDSASSPLPSLTFKNGGSAAMMGAHQVVKESLELASSAASLMEVECDPAMAERVATLTRQRATSVVYPADSQCSIEYNDWEIEAKDIEIMKRADGSLWLLGSGAFGKVYKAIKDGVTPCAVKLFPLKTVSTGLQRMRTGARFQDEETTKREVAILKSCRDRNIVQFLGAVLGGEQAMLITEYMEGGDLYAAVHGNVGGSFVWYKNSGKGTEPCPGMGKRIALDIARGLHFLHSRKIVHLDLKSSNVLLGRNYVAKVADVGMAMLMQCTKDSGWGITLSDCVGTFAWTAPELLLGQRCTEKVDIYSYGVILWEIITGETPRRGKIRDIRAPEECPFAVAALVQRCLCSDPVQRPTAREIVEVLIGADLELERMAIRKKSLRPGSRSGSLTPPLEGAKDPPMVREMLHAFLEVAHHVGGPMLSKLSFEGMRSYQPAGYARMYKDWVAQVSCCLQVRQVFESGSDEQQRLQTLVHSLRRALAKMDVVYPQFLHNFSRINMEAVCSGALPSRISLPSTPHSLEANFGPQPADKRCLEWRPVCNALALPVALKLQIVKDRQELFEQLRPIQEKRKLLADAPPAVWHGTGQCWVSEQQMSEQFKVSMAEEGHKVKAFAEQFFSKRVGHIGEARVRLAAWPFMPDPLAISGIVAAEMAASRQAADKAGAASSISRSSVKRRATSFPT